MDFALRNRWPRVVVPPRRIRTEDGSIARLNVIVGEVELTVREIELRSRLETLEVVAHLDVVTPFAQSEEPIAGDIELLAGAFDEPVEGAAVVVLAVGEVENRRAAKPAAALERSHRDQRAVIGKR